MFQTRVGKALSFAIEQQRSEAISVLRTVESQVTSRGAYDPEAVYKIAQAYAVLGDKASALRVMRHSIENGFFPYSYLLTDPLLENVRSGAELPSIARHCAPPSRGIQKSVLLSTPQVANHPDTGRSSPAHRFGQQSVPSCHADETQSTRPSVKTFSNTL